MSAHELLAAPRPELLEEPSGERCRRARGRLWIAQVERHLTDTADVRVIDPMERDDDRGARARGLQAVVIDGPVEDPFLVEHEIPIGGEELVVGHHRAGLGAPERGAARGLAVALSRGASGALPQPIEALCEGVVEPQVLFEEACGNIAAPAKARIRNPKEMPNPVAGERSPAANGRKRFLG